MNSESCRKEVGFTVLEVAVSMTIIALLMCSMFSVTVETSTFLRDNDMNSVLQQEAQRALDRLTEILRKSGRVDAGGGVVYPLVTGGGTELQFRVLSDLDGNGYAFNETTGGVEWGPKVFTARVDAGGNLNVYDGATPVFALGRFVTNLRFETVAQNPALHFKEVRIRFEARRTAPSGYDAIYPVDASIHMRN